MVSRRQRFNLWPIFVFEYWKVYNLIPFLVEKTMAGFRQINNVALTNPPE